MTDGTNERPHVALISNSNTPYRLHLHTRIAREISEVNFWSLLTHEASNADWKLQAPPEIRPVAFGAGERSEEQDRISRAWWEWRKGGRIIEWLCSHDARAVVLSGYNDPGRLRVIRWCHRSGVPCLLAGDSNVRGDCARGVKRVLKSVLLPAVLKRCTAALPCGELGQQYFERYGVPRTRTFLFPYEPDYALIHNVTDDAVRATAERFGLVPGRRRFIFSGRIAPVKRPELVVNAFVQIAGLLADWDLLIVGGGPLEAQLRASVPTALRHRITWTGFIGGQAEVAALYRLADVLVLSSDNEPWGLVINEAVAARLAVVCTDVVGAAAELVRDGINGRLFPIGDVNRLTECLLDVTRPERLAAMKTASAEVLRQWRERGDPVAGLRNALQFCGVLPPRSETK